MKKIKTFDYFAFTPQFLVRSGNKQRNNSSYGSYIGGSISVFGLVLSIIYLFYLWNQMYSYVNDKISHHKTRNLYEKSYSMKDFNFMPSIAVLPYGGETDFQFDYDYFEVEGIDIFDIKGNIDENKLKNYLEINLASIH